MTPRRTTTRRVCKWAAVVLGVPVLLPSGYVSAWLAVSAALSHGLISAATAAEFAPAFEPIQLYCRAELPGAEQLQNIWWDVGAPDLSWLPEGALPLIDPGQYVLAP